MAKTIAQMRASGTVGQAESVFPMYLNGTLVAKLQEALAEVDEAREARDELGEPDPDKPVTRRMTDVDPRVAADALVAEKEAAAEAVRAEMAEDLVEVKFRAKEPGAWVEWKSAHPPREDNAADMATDTRFGFNLDAMIIMLPDWIVSISGEPLAPGDGEWLLGVANYGDLREGASLVARMQEGGIRVPKSLTSSPAGKTSSAG